MTTSGTRLAVGRAPRHAAKFTPFGAFAYGAYGIFRAHALSLRDGLQVAVPAGGMTWRPPLSGAQARQVVYGVVRVGPIGDAGYVLPQAIGLLALGVCLLAVTGAPGGRAVRHAFAQLRGANDQPKMTPPLLLLPVIFLWEELFSQLLWFGYHSTVWAVLAVGLFAAGAALVAWLPRVAAAVAVLGTVVLGVAGVMMSLRIAVPVSTPAQWFTTTFYGAVALHDRFYWPVLPGRGPVPGTVVLRLAGADGALALLLTAAQGVALLVAGALLATRLPIWSGDAELAGHARALTQRVTRLAETRRDATETAVAELRRIERDLHDGAQARLVAVGMSLRAAEQLMPAHPEAALALVAEARETSSRALDDLRDLVRGIYPPVLADRGLSDAVRALALDAPLTVDTDITLAEEPPVPVAAAVYFAIAEALTNAVRHSGADTVQIGIGYADGMLRAVVTDDGQGGADPAAGTGLSGVERRLATFDGILAVTSPPGGPTIIAIEVPCMPALAYGSGWAGVVRSSWQTRTLI